MYKLHLILKYLRKRRIAWVSLIAVTLCTTMVLVVISVMGGWLRMFKQSFHGLTGDIIVQGESLTGFPYYQDVLERVRKLPEVKAAVPALQTWGLININNSIRKAVQVIGYTPDVGEVNNFPKSLHRQYQERVKAGKTPATQPSWELLPYKDYHIDYHQILPTLKGFIPGMIVGTGVIGISKNEQGKWERPDPEVEYSAWANLKVLGINPDESIDPEKNTGDRTYFLVDDSRTGTWQYDSNTVYVPFKVLQQDLRMNGSDGQPARTSEIEIRINPGYDLNATRDKVAQIVDQVMSDHQVDVLSYPYKVETWEQSQALWLNAIEHEKMLVTILFGIISIVAIFLIFCIFYMIVAEKTKDIGIIKSVGATSTGVAGIFLGYGLAIGIVGAGLGFLAGWGIVHNINFLHSELAKLLHVQIWNPEVYAFDTIPDTMNPHEVIVICAIAVVSSVLGSVIPAIRAARMNPVEALRWE